MRTHWFGLGLVLSFMGCGGSTANDGGGNPSQPDGGGTNIPTSKPADKVDLLVMVDNSISMTDKQALLKEAVPALLNVLMEPPTDAGGTPLYAAVKDVHLGVITSSLGGHGGDTCAPGAQFNPLQDDRGHLLPSVRTGLDSFENSGFLWWDPAGNFGGESDSASLGQSFREQIESAGEQGCGYEASLESWYRFLIDPEPAETVTQEDGVVKLSGTDATLLAQRKAFLRPDSLVIIVTLSDENDCSIAEQGTNWMFAQHSPPGSFGHYFMPRGTAACQSDPASVCCRSCGLEETSPPAGCQPLDNDASCLLGEHSEKSDHLNLRCWEQTRRFGADGLYPTRRYVDGLTGAMVPNRAGKLVTNPLFDDGSGVTRALDNVLFVPIVGVPWQDVATDDSLNGSGLTYLSAAELAEKGRWNWLVPACKSVGANGVCDTWDYGDQPDDPLMIESTVPRTGVNPATGIALAGPDATTGANPINGHEMNITNNDDLQYACTFQLPEPRDCSKVAEGTDCQCDAYDSQVTKSPLCQEPDGSYGVVQRSAKAYPGTRQLEVAMGMGNNAVVGSICPKSLEPTNSALAYIPIVNAIASQLPGRLVK